LTDHLTDLNTILVIPWEWGEKSTARAICSVYSPGGELFAGDPRTVLRRVIDEAAELGYTFNAGPEVEFFLFVPEESGRIRPLPHDRAGYFDFSTHSAPSPPNHTL